MKPTRTQLIAKLAQSKLASLSDANKIADVVGKEFGGYDPEPPAKTRGMEIAEKMISRVGPYNRLIFNHVDSGCNGLTTNAIFDTPTFNCILDCLASHIDVAIAEAKAEERESVRFEIDGIRILGGMSALEFKRAVLTLPYSRLPQSGESK